MRRGGIPVLVAMVLVTAIGVAGLLFLQYAQTTLDRNLVGQLMLLVGGVLAFLNRMYRDEQAVRLLKENTALTAAAVQAAGVDPERVKVESKLADERSNL